MEEKLPKYFWISLIIIITSIFSYGYTKAIKSMIVYKDYYENTQELMKIIEDTHPSFDDTIGETDVYIEYTWLKDKIKIEKYDN